MRSTICRLLSLALCAVYPSLPQDQQGFLRSTGGVPGRTGVGITERRLTLQAAVEMAVKNNLDVEIERSTVASASQAIRAAQGSFDPAFRLRPTWQAGATPAISILQATDGSQFNRNWGTGLQLVQPLPKYGTRLNVDFDSSRVTTNNPFTTMNPYFTSRLWMGVTQPLMRGLRTDSTRTELRIRRKELNVAEAGFRLQLIDVIARVEQSYWELVAARQDIDVRRESVELAQRQLDMTSRLAQAGEVAEVEMAAAEAELERRRDDLYRAISRLSAVENQLKTILASDIADPVWSEQVVPIEAASSSDDHELRELSELVHEAMKARVELQQFAHKAEIVAAEKRLAGDLTRPQVDVVAGYVSTGLAGSALAGRDPFTASSAALYQQVNALSQRAGLQPIAPPAIGGLTPELTGNYGSTLSNVFSGRYETFQVGVSIDLNFRNRTAEANLVRAGIADKRLTLERKKAQQAINQQVRDAVQEIEMARQRIASAAASARSAREKLDSETRLYQTGESTNFLVLTRQNEYSNSRARLIAANVDLNQARARLEQTIGATLRTYGIQAVP